MTQLASLLRVTLFATAAVALASACGGQSFSGDASGDAGSSGKAQGGTTAHAGTTGTAGKGHAGSSAGGSSSTGGSSAGGSSSTGGTGGGAGGAPAEGCYGPPESGNCEAYVPSWYHDPSTGICRPFVYGGCGGNKNRYSSLEACNKACPGGVPNYDACNVASDCMVSPAGCCGVCDGPNVVPIDLVAYNKKFANELFDRQCTGGIACGACPPSVPGQGTMMYFVPDCLAGQCVVQDLRNSPLTACKTSNDCRLRHGTDCCEACSNDQLVSIRNDGSFEKFVCGSGPVGCLACIAPPSDAEPFCGPTGHCEVVHPL